MSDCKGPSCCSPMDEHAYAEQARALRSYSHIKQIPRDPYDVPVALAQRLLGYQAGHSPLRARAIDLQAGHRDELREGTLLLSLLAVDGVRGT